MKDNIIKLESIYINDFYDDFNDNISEDSSNIEVINQAHKTISTIYKRHLDEFTNNRGECPEIRVLMFEGIDNFASIDIFHSQHKQDKYKIL